MAPSLNPLSPQACLQVPLEPAADAPLEMVNVTCWGWTGVARDEGGAAAAWLSDFLERPVRLVRYAGAEPRQAQLPASSNASHSLGPPQGRGCAATAASPHA